MNGKLAHSLLRALALLVIAGVLAGCATRYEDRYRRHYHVDEYAYGGASYSVGVSYYDYYYDPFWYMGPSFVLGYRYQPSYYRHATHFPYYYDYYWDYPGPRHRHAQWYSPRHPWFREHRRAPSHERTAREATRLTRPAIVAPSYPDRSARGPRIIRGPKGPDPLADDAVRLNRPTAPTVTVPRRVYQDPAPDRDRTPSRQVRSADLPTLPAVRQPSRSDRDDGQRARFGSRPVIDSRPAQSAPRVVIPSRPQHRPAPVQQRQPVSRQREVVVRQPVIRPTPTPSRSPAIRPTPPPRSSSPPPRMAPRPSPPPRPVEDGGSYRSRLMRQADDGDHRRR